MLEVVITVTAAICSVDFLIFVLRKSYLDGQVNEFEVAGPCNLLLEYDDSVQICFPDIRGNGH
jgi:hypothetical protein